MKELKRTKKRSHSENNMQHSTAELPTIPEKVQSEIEVILEVN